MTRGLLLAGLVGLLVPGATRAGNLFREQVAPLLERRCLACHDASRKRGGLDLSSRAGLLAGSDNGPVLAAGQPDRSRLVQMISGPSPRMPRTGTKLRGEEVALVRRWIAAGAAWPDGLVLKASKEAGPEETWWSLRPIVRPAVPAVKDPTWPRTPVDAFILAALEARGLSPSPRADRRTLIRRLSFDLTGLPPSPEEVEAFVNDARPNAWDRLISRLLDSPAYGERWGRHWLDVAHYGDTHGYDKDKRRDNAWPYRDWVIRALNRDIPYADFVREQLAGDVLKPGDPEGLVAAGFVVAGPWDFVGHVELREGTVDKEKTRVLDRDDMVSSATGAFLSLTAGCARCHDHKFDPIPMRDYYRLHAVFSGVERGNRPLAAAPTDGQQRLLAEKKRFLHLRAGLEKKIRDLRSPELTRLAERRTALDKRLAGLPLPSGTPSPTNGYHSGILPTPDHTRWVQVDLGSTVGVDEVRLFPARPVDFPDNPGFGFPARFRVELCDEPTFKAPLVLADHTGADFANPGDNPVVVSGKGRKGRFVRVTATRLWKRRGDFVFALAELQVESGGKNLAAGKAVSALDSIEAGRWSRRHLADDHDSRQRLPDLGKPSVREPFLERLRLAEELRKLTREKDALTARLIPAEVRKQLADADDHLARLEARLKAAPRGPEVYSVVSIAPRPIHVLWRGDVEQKRAEVTPGGLTCVPGLDAEFALDGSSGEGRRRLALANWIASPKNPLTWRSAVNRVWHYHFGRGIVDTPNDFGKMGSKPTHPELLDWLASEFLAQGGSLKKLHRLIVTSAVYQQTSRHDEAAVRQDSDNRYLWRMNRLRLDAESIRDATLAVNGQLSRQMGGKGYDLFRFKDDHSPVYDHSDLGRIHDPATYRRTVYRFTVRSVPNPFLDSLDCADPNLSTPVRNTTLTALQALALLNNPFMVRQANLFADRVRTEAASPEGQISRAFLLAFGRTPGWEESAALLGHARKHGLAAVCRVLLNANEFVFVD